VDLNKILVSEVEEDFELWREINSRFRKSWGLGV
jgi:hypothetical protein